AGLERLAFTGKDFLHPTARARSDVRFIYFDRAGNGVIGTLTAGHSDRAQQQRRHFALHLPAIAGSMRIAKFIRGAHKFTSWNRSDRATIKPPALEMKTRFFDHIDLRVRNRARAQQFYSKVLPALGFVHDQSGERWGPFELES